MTTPPAPLSYHTITRFWYPLAGAWLMMAAEGPLIAAIIARLGDPALNLAAYGVAIAFALVTESPVIMLMSASTALVREAQSYRKLQRFSLALCLIVTLFLACFCIPSLFAAVAIAGFGLDPEVAWHAHAALLFLLPWPAAIGMRRFYQGLMIRHGQTQRIALGTVVRLGAMTGSALLLAAFSPLHGTTIGGAALSCGVITEALTIRLLAAGTVRTIKACHDPHPEGELTVRGLCAFYLPLAMTPVLALSVQPMITFFLGRALFPVESLAVTPVVNALTFLFRAVALSYQEVAIALMGERFRHYDRIRSFGRFLAFGTTLPLALIAFTPLSGLWLEQVSGLPEGLARFAIAPLCIQAILPALTLSQSLQRAVLLGARVTTPISLATALETGAIFLILLLLVRFSPFSGAVDAALALVCGRLIGLALLARPNRTVLRDFREKRV